MPGVCFCGLYPRSPGFGSPMADIWRSGTGSSARAAGGCPWTLRACGVQRDGLGRVGGVPGYWPAPLAGRKWQGSRAKDTFFYLPGLSRAPMRLTVTMASSAGERPPVLQTWLVAVVGACSTAARACSLVLASGVVYLLWKASLFFWDGACAVFSCCGFTCKPCVYAGI